MTVEQDADTGPMEGSEAASPVAATDAARRKPRPAAAERALAEAAARRKAAASAAPPEVDGRGGLEPVRYGDWEIKGLASDF